MKPYYDSWPKLTGNILFLCLGLSVNALSAASTEIESHDSKIGDVQLHYLTAGNGPAAVILLHGFAETSRMWRPIMPLLRKSLP